MAGYAKKATQLVGLAVAKAPRKTLTEIYSKTLGVLSTLPESSVYRQQVEHITNQRLELVKKTEDVMKLEKLINCGQIEEVMVQASDELQLVEQMAQWQVWEAPESQAPAGQW
ncbi:NADH dehydrogenase [ubiquinone] 1 alpha subcomplex subunit 5-like [Clytia hemisphaerica]|uniref:NADH dehydrogenase [ubiquinone] 1 alpha subcomplex subunit 5 n=1 Tax=Clytia hemisphaerica TaxID=252671 RepID=A0A7M5V1V6_9CNID|eukprot:TCONS_00007660-protein